MAYVLQARGFGRAHSLLFEVATTCIPFTRSVWSENQTGLIVVASMPSGFGHLRASRPHQEARVEVGLPLAVDFRKSRPGAPRGWASLIGLIKRRKLPARIQEDPRVPA